MIVRWLLMSLAVVVFAPGLLRAQEKITATLTFRAVPDHDKMYEDVEIFRRILDRKLEPLYPQYSLQRLSKTVAPIYTLNQGRLMALDAANGAINRSWLGVYGVGDVVWADLGQPIVFPNNNSYWFQELSSPQEVRHPLEGVYLKGQGVVYTATLSSLQPATANESAKPVSEWESTRRQLRNEKEEPKNPQASKPPDLSEVLLKVLAENGHHFSQLGENESLTVVITVHDNGQSAPAPKSGEGSANAKPQSPPAEEKDASASTKARDLELLGDLHLKQGQNEEALKAFQKALELKQLDPKQSAALYRKLAQCYLALEKIGEARSALDKAAEVLKNMQEAANAQNKPAAKPPAAALPAKLIISAPKKLLDQVKEGKISFEEFRRQASVETLKFDGKRR
jgi:tetratricopeptide (TPR) repeat protein